MIQEPYKSSIDVCLECSWCVGQPKRHYKVLKMSVWDRTIRINGVFDTTKIRKFRSLIGVENPCKVFAIIPEVFRNLRGPFPEGVDLTRHILLSCITRIMQGGRDLVTIAYAGSPLSGA